MTQIIKKKSDSKKPNPLYVDPQSARLWLIRNTNIEKLNAMNIGFVYNPENNNAIVKFDQSTKLPRIMSLWGDKKTSSYATVNSKDAILSVLAEGELRPEDIQLFKFSLYLGRGLSWKNIDASFIKEVEIADIIDVMDFSDISAEADNAEVLSEKIMSKKMAKVKEYIRHERPELFTSFQYHLTSWQAYLMNYAGSPGRVSRAQERQAAAAEAQTDVLRELLDEIKKPLSATLDSTNNDRFPIGEESKTAPSDDPILPEQGVKDND